MMVQLVALCHISQGFDSSQKAQNYEGLSKCYSAEAINSFLDLGHTMAQKLP